MFINELIDFVYPLKSVLTDELIRNKEENKYWNIEDINLLEKLNPSQLDIIKSKLNCDYFYSDLIFKEENYTQKLVHSIKYFGLKNLGVHCGKYFSPGLMNYLKKEKLSIDFLIPVPLHPVKERERGFNQSYYIAKGISEISMIPLETKILKRVKNTKSQTKLTITQRKQNVANAFKIDDLFLSLIRKKNILLLDDVVTTGSTLNEICYILRKNEVNKIVIYTLSSVIN
ncbi:MAG: ComF family protein [Ignavibacteria bacterium]|nr:ComF family protein [Ignavibacteria bacterium]